MTKILSTHNTDDDKGNAKVMVDGDTLVIEYTDNAGHKFFTEDYPNKSYAQVNKIAEDWAGGHKTLYG